MTQSLEVFRSSILTSDKEYKHNISSCICSFHKHQVIKYILQLLIVIFQKFIQIVCLFYYLMYLFLYSVISLIEYIFTKYIFWQLHLIYVHKCLIVFLYYFKTLNKISHIKCFAIISQLFCYLVITIQPSFLLPRNSFRLNFIRLLNKYTHE